MSPLIYIMTQMVFKAGVGRNIPYVTTCFVSSAPDRRWNNACDTDYTNLLFKDTNRSVFVRIEMHTRTTTLSKCEGYIAWLGVTATLPE